MTTEEPPIDNTPPPPNRRRTLVIAAAIAAVVCIAGVVLSPLPGPGLTVAFIGGLVAMVLVAVAAIARPPRRPTT